MSEPSYRLQQCIKRLEAAIDEARTKPLGGWEKIRVGAGDVFEVIKAFRAERERVRQMEEALHHLCVRMELQLAGTQLPWIDTWIDIARRALDAKEPSDAVDSTEAKLGET